MGGGRGNTEKDFGFILSSQAKITKSSILFAPSHCSHLHRLSHSDLHNLRGIRASFGSGRIFHLHPQVVTKQLGSIIFTGTMLGRIALMIWPYLCLV